MSYLSDRDLAEKFDKSVEWIQDRCRAKEWPHLKVGSSLRFTEADVAAIEQLCRVPVATPPVSAEWDVAPGRRSA